MEPAISVRQHRLLRLRMLGDALARQPSSVSSVKLPP